MTKILGFSGKKQSGKNTGANFVIGHVLQEKGLIDQFKLNSKGELVVWSSWSNGDVFDFAKAGNRYDKYVKLYSFADALKQDVCINILGLTWDQCYGTDEQKNTPTHLKWENMPGVFTEDRPEWLLGLDGGGREQVNGRLGRYYERIANGFVYHKPGFMTAREVMQFVGTEIFRKMLGDVWVNATINKIERDESELAIICDVRFINEVEGVHNNGGNVVRFLRDPNKGQDQHESETALDDYPLNLFFEVIDNSNMSIPDQNKAVLAMLNRMYNE